MKTIVVTTQKGGAGKSTLVAHLSVEFDRLGKHVAVLDTDRQGSIGFWSQQRASKAPQILKVPFAEFSDYQAACEREGFDYLIVDTPPHAGAGIQSVVSKSDLIIVPVRPGPLDIAALDGTVEFLPAEKTIFVLNQVPSVGTEASETRNVLASLYSDFMIAKGQVGVASTDVV